MIPRIFVYSFRSLYFFFVSHHTDIRANGEEIKLDGFHDFVRKDWKYFGPGSSFEDVRADGTLGLRFSLGRRAKLQVSSMLSRGTRWIIHIVYVLRSQPLLRAKRKPYTSIIIDCSYENLGDILKQTQEVGMMTGSYRYIITSLVCFLSTLDNC